MPIDVLVLNTAVVDLRSPDFTFCDQLVGKGGLAKCRTEDMPLHSQEQIADLIRQGKATAGGYGNNAPLMARAVLSVAALSGFGKGEHETIDHRLLLDAQCKFYYDTMASSGINMTFAYANPTLMTGTTFIHDASGGERGGIAYFPNANNELNFSGAKAVIELLQPRIVYYMYSGLSDCGDANGGKDLADFIKGCRGQGAVTIADTHCLTGHVDEALRGTQIVAGYNLLGPLLPEVDIFFCSTDEAGMIARNTELLGNFAKSRLVDPTFPSHFINKQIERRKKEESRTRLYVVTCSTGAYQGGIMPDRHYSMARKVTSNFLTDQLVDLVGAGDSFRAGLITYIANNLEAWRNGSIDIAKAVQMGNLFASIFISAPLNDRYSGVLPYKTMNVVVEGGNTYANRNKLIGALHAIS